MVLQDSALHALAGKLFPENTHVGPSSIDLTLSRSFSKLNPRHGVIYADNAVEYDHILVEGDRYTIAPGGFVLACSEEWVDIPSSMVGYCHGRSSLGRMGLQVQNAGFIDAGFQGQITLELANQTRYPIVLAIGMRVAQIVFCWQEKPSENPYSGKYQGQTGATPPRMEMEIRRYECEHT